jgi:hypothetical protein
MAEFVSGAMAMGFGVVGLFFLRFWRRTGDRLFGLFAISFSLMAVNRAMLGVVHLSENGYPYVYLVRLLANLLIIYGIVDKNRAKQGAVRRP